MTAQCSANSSPQPSLQSSQPVLVEENGVEGKQPVTVQEPSWEWAAVFVGGIVEGTYDGEFFSPSHRQTVSPARATRRNAIGAFWEAAMRVETCALPLTEATVTVNGVDLFYRIGGDGPPLLLIHGFSRTGHMWEPFLDQLGEHYTVVLPDLPGCGGSTSRPGEFSHRQTARDMFALLDELGIDCIRGIGHSAGAVTLIHMATQRPNRVAAMVLVDGAHRCPVEARETMRTVRLETLPQKHQEYLRRFHPGGEPQSRTILARFRGLADDYDDFDLSPEHLATIVTRTLLVWGDRDPWFPVEFALEMHQAIPNTALWVVPNQGHYPIWDSNEAATIFPAVVRKFLEQSQPNKKA